MKSYHIGNRRGQALVEFALVLPILLLMVVGLIEMARAWNMHQVITDAAREGCRRAVIADPTITQAQVDSVIKSAIAIAGFDSSRATVSYPNGFKTGSGKLTACRIEMPYAFGLLKPLMATLYGNGIIVMKTMARFRNE